MLFVVNTRTPLFVCSTSWLATVDCVNYMYYKQDIMDSLCIKLTETMLLFYQKGMRRSFIMLLFAHWYQL